MHRQGTLIMLERGRSIHRRFTGIVVLKGQQSRYYSDFAGKVIIVPDAPTDPLWISRPTHLSPISVGERIRLQLIAATGAIAAFQGIAVLL